MLRILNVDPDVTTAGWMRAALSAAGYECELISISSGREAFELLLGQTFDLCVLEYALDEITGAELCSLLRRNGCSVPVVILSATDRVVDRARAAAAGVDLYLSKPEDMPRFAERVALLAGARPKERTSEFSATNYAVAA